MKSVRSKVVNAALVAILTSATAFQHGIASQTVQASHLEKPVQQTTAPWNTFVGGAGDDRSYSLARDESGNLVVVGYSATSWGNPLRAYNAGTDGFVAKLDPSGNLLWNTFLGGELEDGIQAVTFDDSGNIYVIGSSGAGWGAPLQPHVGVQDDFIAKLGADGNLVWNTFLGVQRNSNLAGIVLDSLGNIYASTSNKLSAESPSSAGVIKLDATGAAVWNSLFGGSQDTFAHAIALDKNQNVLVTGVSYATWGNPIRAYTGAIDAFVAKLDHSTGALLWNTFLGGGNGRDTGYGLTLDGSNNIYMAGHSTASWGHPVRAFSGDQDGIVVKLGPSGNLVWNTFLGGAGVDYSGYEIELDGNGNIFVPGASNATWGIPVQSYTGDYDAVIAKLDPAGGLIANTFLGGGGIDKSYGIAVGESEDVILAGYSNATWGEPVGPYTGDTDGFVVSTSLQGVPASLIVTKSDDTQDGNCDSDCSLREAIAAASPASVISFDPALAGQTIALTSTLLVDKNLVMDGSALNPPVQVSGDSNGDSQGDVLAISVAAGASVEMRGINVNRGDSGENGGGIRNAGHLTLRNCRLNANRAGSGAGIYNSSNAYLFISNCVFSNNNATGAGGGIANFGNLEISQSTFFSNQASGAQGLGSAIYNEGTATISKSTFYDNLQGTGTLYHASTLDTASLVLENSSFEKNNTAVYSYSGKAVLNNNTIYLNKGGLHVFSGLVDVNNTIVSHNFNGSDPTDCVKDAGGTVGKDVFNFFSSAGNCGVAVSGYDVSLEHLAENGGPTQTMALKPTSPAINAGQDASCATADQRGLARPQGTHCDIGAYEYGEEFAPMVVSITLLDPFTTSLQRVQFKVRFSERVTGVDASDFSFFKTGSIRNYAIKNIFPTKGPADSYIVNVDTGKYNGSLRLRLVDNDSIKDVTKKPLGGPGKGNGNFAIQQGYTISKTYSLNLRSIAIQDGWMLESGEKTGKGGQLNKTGNTIYLGDNAQKKQYRSMLSFKTNGLPDKAIITKITLKLRRQTSIGPGDPLKIFKGFVFDIKKGFFGPSAGLQLSDFRASAHHSYGPFQPALTKGWYLLNLTPAKTDINRLNTNGGVTQIRLRFKLDDNNNKVANSLKLYSGNATAAYRPQLVIDYYVP